MNQGSAECPESYHLFWGKTGRRADGSDGWHPIVPITAWMSRRVAQC